VRLGGDPDGGGSSDGASSVDEVTAPGAEKGSAPLPVTLGAFLRRPLEDQARGVGCTLDLEVSRREPSREVRWPPPLDSLAAFPPLGSVSTGTQIGHVLVGAVEVALPARRTAAPVAGTMTQELGFGSASFSQLGQVGPSSGPGEQAGPAQVGSVDFSPRPGGGRGPSDGCHVPQG
jgi:hypothetical protein